MKLPPGAGPCRKHPCSVEHAELVTSYRLARLDFECRREMTAKGYGPETQDGPGPTFKEWLRQNHQNREE